MADNDTYGLVARLRALAGGVGLAGIVGALVVGVMGSTRPVWGNQSLASLASLMALSVLGILGMAALMAPVSWWRAVQAAVPAWREIETSNQKYTGSRLLPSLLVALALGCQVLTILHYSAANQVARADQAHYLEVADSVNSLGGSTALSGALVRGVFREDNRNPLYVALLALHPTLEFGKTLSGLGGLAVTIAMTVVGYHLGGARVAVVAAVLGATNAALARASTLVACETLLTLLILIAWILETRPNAVGRPMIYRGIYHGICWGLAYMTKASAMILFFYLLAVSCARTRRRFGWKLGLWGSFWLLVGFTTISFPLLMRNLRVYGNPLHSFNNKLLFADSYEEGVNAPDLGTFGNWQRYRARHGWNEIGARLFQGIIWETFVLIRSLGPMPLDSGRVVPGLALLLLALVNMACDPRLRGDLLLGWVLLFVLFFGWYLPIAASDRFVLPLVPPLLIASALGITRALLIFFGPNFRDRFLPVFALGYLSIFTVTTLVFTR